MVASLRLPFKRNIFSHYVLLTVFSSNSHLFQLLVIFELRPQSWTTYTMVAKLRPGLAPSNTDQLLDAMDDQEDTQEIIEQKLINEEYKIWKKNTPFLYDMLWA